MLTKSLMDHYCTYKNFLQIYITQILAKNGCKCLLKFQKVECPALKTKLFLLEHLFPLFIEGTLFIVL